MYEERFSPRNLCRRTPAEIIPYIPLTLFECLIGAATYAVSFTFRNPEARQEVRDNSREILHKGLGSFLAYTGILLDSEPIFRRGEELIDEVEFSSFAREVIEDLGV